MRTCASKFEGRVHESGPPEALFSAPQTPELRQFLSALHG
jgi:polar amino acid transport system ATP-binding protein